MIALIIHNLICPASNLGIIAQIYCDRQNSLSSIVAWPPPNKLTLTKFGFHHKTS